MKFNTERIQIRVKMMTGWQRHQWAKAGRPVTTKKLDHFIALAHHRRKGMTLTA